jgi:hypothetical protein
MLAVDPEGQRQGLGRVLTDHATVWLCDAGMRVAMIGTGGDPGHAPGRRVYERAGYRAMPIARYFKALGAGDVCAPRWASRRKLVPGSSSGNAAIEFRCVGATKCANRLVLTPTAGARHPPADCCHPCI